MRGRMRLIPILLAALALGAAATRAVAAEVRITSPQNGEVVQDAAGSLFVNITLGESDLRPEMRFRLRLDGRLVTPLAYVPVFRLHDVSAGPHVLEALIVDQDGKVVQASDPVRFRMLRREGAEPEPDAPLPSG